MAKTALITGASSGIGAELARLHAANGDNLILVARRIEKLEALKAELNNVQVECISMDLTVENAAQKLFDEVSTRNIEIDYLINNAGFGGQGYFHERPWKDENNMMQLNMVTLAQLCHLFLPTMVKRDSGRILNIASSAGLIPGGPLQSMYFATKAFVVSLSNGIAGELKGSNVTITALCPGATETEFEKTAGLQDTDLFSGKIYSAKSVATDGFNAMMAGKRQKKTALGFMNSVNFKLMPFIPDGVILGMIKKMQVKKS
jgi:short-subunit dehydrogenase